MKWPERHTCHAGEPMLVAKGEWRPAVVKARRGSGSDEYSPIIEPYRSCDYCGSIHPEDLLAVLAAGAKLHPADEKYGWPHKFYVEEIPNPLVGVPTIRSAEHTSEGITLGEPRPEGPYTHGKFYIAHIADEGYDDEARAMVILELWKRIGVHFVVNERGLGYQRLPPRDARPTPE